MVDSVLFQTEKLPTFRAHKHCHSLCFGQSHRLTVTQITVWALKIAHFKTSTNVVPGSHFVQQIFKRNQHKPSNVRLEVSSSWHLTALVMLSNEYFLWIHIVQHRPWRSWAHAFFFPWLKCMSNILWVDLHGKDVLKLSLRSRINLLPSTKLISRLQIHWD